MFVAIYDGPATASAAYKVCSRRTTAKGWFADSHK